MRPSRVYRPNERLSRRTALRHDLKGDGAVSALHLPKHADCRGDTRRQGQRARDIQGLPVPLSQQNWNRGAYKPSREAKEEQGGGWPRTEEAGQTGEHAVGNQYLGPSHALTSTSSLKKSLTNARGVAWDRQGEDEEGEQ